VLLSPAVALRLPGAAQSHRLPAGGVHLVAVVPADPLSRKADPLASRTHVLPLVYNDIEVMET
jgi:hypothetical protein